MPGTGNEKSVASGRVRKVCSTSRNQSTGKQLPGDHVEVVTGIVFGSRCRSLGPHVTRTGLGQQVAVAMVPHRCQQFGVFFPVVQVPITDVHVRIDQGHTDLGNQQKLLAGADQVVMVRREDQATTQCHTKKERRESAHAERK